jgi:MFS family permease
MALVGSAFGLGVVFGPALGAGLSHWGLLVPVYVSAAVALLNGVFVWMMLPETSRHTHLSEFAPSVAVLSRVWPVLGVGFVTTLSAVSMEQTVAFLFQDTLHLGAESAARHVGMALVFYGILSVVAQGFIVRKMRWSPLRLLFIGGPLSAIGLLGLVMVSDFPSMTAALGLQGLGFGLVMPAMAGALSLSVGEAEQGEVAGLNSATQALSRTLGPILGTYLYGIHMKTPYQSSAVLLVLVLVGVATNSRLRRRISTPRVSSGQG